VLGWLRQYRANRRRAAEDEWFDSLLSATFDLRRQAPELRAEGREADAQAVEREADKLISWIDEQRRKRDAGEPLDSGPDFAKPSV
jgi:hypothetical protein